MRDNHRFAIEINHMKFSLDYRLHLGDEEIPLPNVLAEVEVHRDALAELGQVLGDLCITIGGNESPADYSDPIMRFALGWIQKVPWVIGGDTETVALCNSEQCYAFVPSGDGVELSFFNGTESEIEEYIFEPTQVMLDDFATQSISLAARLLELVEALDAGLLESDEDCRDLKAGLDEARKAWHDFEVHKRR